MLKYVKLLIINELIIKFDKLEAIHNYMRLILLIFLVLLSNRIFGQQITGLVLSEDTKKPIKDAKVTTPTFSMLTSSTGFFSLDSIHVGDTVKVSHIGYKSFYTIYKNKPISDTILVLLKSSPIELQEVVIKRSRYYRQDSLDRRKEFASVFSYNAPRFKDVFITKSPDANIQYAPFQNSTSSLVGINLFSVIGLITKKKTPISKLQKKLLKEEEYNYLDHKFSTEKVRSLTSLKGDSLQNFMNKYRPSIEAAKQMTDYQLILYIKKSYDDFIKTYKHENLPFLNKQDTFPARMGISNDIM